MVFKFVVFTFNMYGSPYFVFQFSSFPVFQFISYFACIKNFMFFEFFGLLRFSMFGNELIKASHGRHVQGMNIHSNRICCDVLFYTCFVKWYINGELVVLTRLHF